MRFQDKVCLVTGGTSGIGKATCLQFANEGGQIIIIDKEEKKGKEVVKLIQQLGRKAIFIKADLSKSQEIKKAITLALKQFKKIDILVNNAGMMTFEPLVKLAEKDWDNVLNVNLKAAYLLCKYCIP